MNARMHSNLACTTKLQVSAVLSPGIIAVQAAPNFFCDMSVLAEQLLLNNDGSISREKKGVKIIHNNTHGAQSVCIGD